MSVFQCIVCERHVNFRYGRRPCICKGCRGRGIHLHKPPRPKPKPPRPGV